ncbi:MAG TPA: C40 family peptidase [Nitrosomonas sp.]|nr:C40 family peptidase [Nitrosomonas sp.]HNK88469.1 C40 family peptidase [Nitrosomonas sp.]
MSGKHRKINSKSKPIPLLIAGGVLCGAWASLAIGHGNASVGTTALNTGPLHIDTPPETVRAARAEYRKAIIPKPVRPPLYKLVVQIAMSKLGVEYVWGAKGPNNFDCSGLTQWSFKQAGVTIGPDTYTQIKEGKPVAPGDIRPGDLIFPSIGHVQLAVSSDKVIEAPGRGMTVRIVNMPGHYTARRMK